MTKQELINSLLADGVTQDIIDSYISHIDSYGLMNEVLEWTNRFGNQGNNIVDAFCMAMDEWDL